MWSTNVACMKIVRVKGLACVRSALCAFVVLGVLACGNGGDYDALRADAASATERGDLVAAEALLSRALVTADTDGRRAEVLAARGTVRRRSGALDLARTDLDAASALFMSAERPLDRASTLHEAGNVALTLGDLDAARALFSDALDISRAQRDAAAELRSLGALAMVLASMEQWHEADAAFHEVLDALAPDDAARRAVVLDHLGLIALNRGAFDEAGRHLRAAVDANRVAGPSDNLVFSMIHLAWWERLAGNPSAADSTLDAAAAALGDRPIPEARAFLAVERGHQRLAAGEDATAELEFAEAGLAEVDAGPESEFHRRVARLRRAQEASESGDTLERGNARTDLPPGVPGVGPGEQPA